MNKLFDIIFDILVLPALIISYILVCINIFISIKRNNESVDINYLLYVSKLKLDVAITENSLVMNTSFVLISSAFYYFIFLIF
jgi:uncharacterized integral membrane protein